MSGLAARLDRALGDLLHALPDLEAAAVVTMDGLPMASALPAGMHEDRVAAMSAALLSLGERAAEGLGRGALRQVYIEGERGTVYLLAAGEDAVLVGVASRGAKAGLMLYELRHTAAQLAHVLDQAAPTPAGPTQAAPPQAAPTQAAPPQAAPAPPDPPLDARPATPGTGADDEPGQPLPWASFSSNQAWT